MQGKNRKYISHKEMTMKKLYLVRHGETLFNQKYLMQGICDSPLTQKGHAQAKAVGKLFKEKGITFDHA